MTEDFPSCFTHEDDNYQSLGSNIPACDHETLTRRNAGRHISSASSCLPIMRKDGDTNNQGVRKLVWRPKIMTLQWPYHRSSSIVFT